VRGVGAVDPAAAGIAARKRIEVEPGLGARMADRLQAATALRTGDRRGVAVADRQAGAKLGIGRVDHLGSRLSGVRTGIEGEPEGEVLAPVVSNLGLAAASGRRRRGAIVVAIRLQPVAARRPQAADARQETVTAAYRRRTP
jgi:hypothetical protein